MTAQNNNLPYISICIPTYNNQTTIADCLESIKAQDYPQDRIEILVIDGGSTDKTLSLCKYNANIIINNRWRIEEKGRALGIQSSHGEIIALIDADNILPEKNTLRELVLPFFYNSEISFSEPKFYIADPGDSLITQYISLIGADDPIAVYLGIYDRYCHFKKDWTDSPYTTLLTLPSYEIIKLNSLSQMPPFGANACLMRKKDLDEITYDPFLHTDVAYSLLKRRNILAMVNTGIVHRQSASLRLFLNKKIRRLTRNYSQLKRVYYFKVSRKKILILILKCLLFLPLLADSFIGYRNKKNKIWFLHPLMVLVTSLAYAYSILPRKKNGIR